MKAGGDRARAERVLGALAGLVRGRVEQPTTAELEYGLHGLFSRLAVDDDRRGRRWRWSLASAGAAVALAAVVLFLVRPHLHASAPALVYRVDGGSVVGGGYLRESGGDGIRLSFSEGTEFVLMPGTRGRLHAVSNAGARIAIEQGTAFFQVTPNTGRTWLVDVGPFLVTVKGTVFTVSWDPLHERFELRLRRGRVAVSGPVSGGDIVLRDGQRLVVDLPRAETLITDEAAEAPTTGGPPPPAPAGGAAAPLGPLAPAAPRAPAAPPSRERPRHWREALASGDWDAILADADRLGVKRVLADAPSDDLFALADAARYRLRMELSREALLAQRRRFPGSARALDAAFLLGRVEEASGHGAARALRWYDDYLARAPSGTYASEALGRKMTLTEQMEGPARARPIAMDYLRRFPEGTYAGSARALTRER